MFTKPCQPIQLTQPVQPFEAPRSVTPRSSGPHREVTRKSVAPTPTPYTPQCETQFRGDLAWGLARELEVQDFFEPGALTKNPDITGPDFILPDGSFAEVKSERYSTVPGVGQYSPNAYIELLSNLEFETLGGPFRALAEGVQTLIYFYPANRTLRFFSVSRLCSRILALMSSGQRASSPRGNANTRGFPSSSEGLQDIYIEVTVPENMQITNEHLASMLKELRS